MTWWPISFLPCEETRKDGALPATAHGLQGRGGARTVTERKYPGACLIRRGQPRPRLRHGLYRYSRQSENHNGDGSHGGLSSGKSTLRIRVSFYSVFNLPERFVCASGQFVPVRLCLSWAWELPPSVSWMAKSAHIPALTNCDFTYSRTRAMSCSLVNSWGRQFQFFFASRAFFAFSIFSTALRKTARSEKAAGRGRGVKSPYGQRLPCGCSRGFPRQSRW